MKAIEFIKKIRKIPNEEIITKLKAHDLGKDFVDEFIGNYTFKISEKELQSFEDPIRDLVENYDSSSVQIGGIGFEVHRKEDEDYYYFGKYEADVLALDKNLKIIVLLEENTENHLLCKCAQNSEKFLEAVLDAAPYLAKCGVEGDLYDNQEISCSLAEHCASVAGGEDYLSFFNMYVGCHK